MRDGCPFCDYAGPSEVLAEFSLMYVIEPLDPVVPGHMIVIPRQHLRDALESPYVTGKVMEQAARLAQRPCNIITSAGAEATQSVMHFHVHVVPRRQGDGLMLPWSA